MQHYVSSFNVVPEPPSPPAEPSTPTAWAAPLADCNFSCRAGSAALAKKIAGEVGGHEHSR
eukprot:6676789-Prymnesium_polylepis.2